MSRQDELGALGAEWDATEAQLNTVTGEKSVLQDALTAAEAEIQRLKDLYEPEEPTPTPRKKMRVGSSLYRESGEDHQEAFARRARDWGAEPEIVRYFFSGMPTGWPQFGEAQSVVSFKPPSVRGMGQGQYDAQLNAWLDSLPKDNKVRRVAVFHEREDDIADGHFTKADARAMDAKMYRLIQEANTRNGTNVRFGLVLMQWTLDPKSGRNVNDYLPTDWTYDWMGWDAYGGDRPDQDLPELTGTRTAFTRCRDATKAHGAANWFICETGTRNHMNLPAAEYDARQAQWITGACGIARELGCRGFMYFDSTVGGDFRILGPKGFAAMGAEIGK